MADLRAAVRDSGAKIAGVDALPVALGDAPLLRQLLQNLLGNAIKYRHAERP